MSSGTSFIQSPWTSSSPQRLLLHLPPLVLALRPIARASLLLYLYSLYHPYFYTSIPSNYTIRKLTILIIKEPRLPLLHHVPTLFTTTTECFSLLRQSSQDPHHLIHARRLSKSSVAILVTCQLVGMTRCRGEGISNRGFELVLDISSTSFSLFFFCRTKRT